MSGGLKSPTPTLAQLRTSLNRLKVSLDPVTTQPLEKLTTLLEDGGAGEEGKLQSAQMNTSLAYVVLDLVWILLKVNGKDPASHAVTSELTRVRDYLVKINKISKRMEQISQGQIPDEDTPAAPPFDKAKVSRFLRHALGTPASGKKTVFAEDGTVQRVVDAGGDSKTAVETEEDGSTQQNTASDEERAKSKKEKRMAQKAEKSMRKASDAIASSKKKRKA